MRDAAHPQSGSRSTSSEIEGARTDTEVLYELTSAISCGESLESIYERAFAALRETLGAERSSVLLLDEKGVMRFEAWRDLSAEYRQAVEGHSPWARGETDWQPLVVRDIQADESWSSYLELFREENIRSLGFLPIVLGEELLGKFMVYYEQPHEFSDRDINVARTITSHIATAIARDRADRKLHASEERLRLAVDAARVGTWDYDLETGVLELDRWARAMFTMAPDIKPGLERLLRHVHPADRVRTHTAMQNALAPGSGGEYDLEYRAIGQRNAEERWIAARGKVLFDERGSARRFVGTFRDVTDAKRDALDRERILADLANAVRFGELLMGIVAHDLRSPLAVIVSATELAMLRSESDRVKVPPGRAAIAWLA
jgi:PAS domain S-box-containing protein